MARQQASKKNVSVGSTFQLPTIFAIECLSKERYVYVEVNEIRLSRAKSGKCIREISNKDKNWLEQELSGCEFKDKRLGKRFKLLCNQLWDGIGKPIPFACQDWASTKAAYRFFTNGRVTEAELFDGHFQSTKERFLKTDGPILVLQDTTEFSYENLSYGFYKRC